MQMTICDRCGAVIEDYKQGRDRCSINLLYVTSTFDLCEDCRNLLDSLIFDEFIPMQHSNKALKEFMGIK